MNSKLNLNWNLVDEARESAKKIAADAQEIGRASCRERV